MHPVRDPVLWVHWGVLSWADLSSRCSGSSIFNFSRVSDFEPFLTLFWSPVGPMLACFSSPIGLLGSIWFLHGSPLWLLLSPQMSSVTLVAPLLAHGLLFARPSKRFAALRLHFWHPYGPYLLVFEVNLTPIGFLQSEMTLPTLG